MGLFNNKERKKEDLSLPDLPNLPEFPRFREENKLPKLPTYPSNSLGDKFSQNAIKSAVSGKRESDLEEADEFEIPEEREQMMQKPLRSPMTREVHFEKRAPMTREIYESEEIENEMSHMPETRVPEQFVEAARRVRHTEPVFIRLDKFEETLKTFEETKKKMSEIEKLLRDINKLKEEEEKELNLWENEMQLLKKKIDIIDREIFSKID